MRGATWATLIAIAVIIAAGLLTIDFGADRMSGTTPSGTQTGQMSAPEEPPKQVVGEPIPDPQSSPDVRPAD